MVIEGGVRSGLDGGVSRFIMTSSHLLQTCTVNTLRDTHASDAVKVLSVVCQGVMITPDSAHEAAVIHWCKNCIM